MRDIKVRTTRSQNQTCPWCRLGFESGEETWGCPKDSTLLHKACVEQFGACATCRAPYGDKSQEIMGFINAMSASSANRATANQELHPVVVTLVGLVLGSPILLAIWATFPSKTDNGQWDWVLSFWKHAPLIVIPFVLVVVSVASLLETPRSPSESEQRSAERPRDAPRRSRP